VLDYQELVEGRPVGTEEEMNRFAQAFCACTPKQLEQMNLGLHVLDQADQKRSGNKDDACEVVLLLMEKHLTASGLDPEPFCNVNILLPELDGQSAFQKWLKSCPEKQDRYSAALTKAQESKRVARPTTEENRIVMEMGELDSVGPGEETGKNSAPTCWADSKLSQGLEDDEMRKKHGESMREKRIEEEKKKVTKVDPLELRKMDFDLRLVQKNKDFLIEENLKALDDMEEEKEDKNSGDGEMEKLLSLERRKESFHSMLERSSKKYYTTEFDENIEEEGMFQSGSVLPAQEDFDPMLFLTLVHGRANYHHLHYGMDRLNNKADSQAMQLQDLVRENFALFVRCADGMDLLVDDSDHKKKQTKKGEGPMIVTERLDSLDKLSDSSSYQAKKSFKPLLDNTNEVRKTQSALAVLKRSAPILQVPAIMRQHVEAGRFSAAVKAYRRVLVIDNQCQIALLQYVKKKAAEAARDARHDLENTLASRNVPVAILLDAIQDLLELNDLDVPNPNKGRSEILKHNLPSVACLLFQSAHFTALVNDTVQKADYMVMRIYGGDSSVLKDGDEEKEDNAEGAMSVATATTMAESYDSQSVATSRSRNNKKWRYDILEARVISTIRSVAAIKEWLPRLLRIGILARQRRRVTRSYRKKNHGAEEEEGTQKLSVYSIFLSDITPVVTKLIQHIAYCALGCTNTPERSSITITYGDNADKSLKSLLNTPLPPRESTRCASELAQLVEVVKNYLDTATTLDAPKNSEEAPLSPLDKADPEAYGYPVVTDPLQNCYRLAKDAVITIERRRCIYAFEVCARHATRRASGSGIFDGETLFNCVQKLYDDTTRHEDLSVEIQKGCQLVIKRCCDGLAEYVRDRGDAARLRAVAECAEMLNGKIVDVVREVISFTDLHFDVVEEELVGDILALEQKLFDEYLSGVRRSVAACVKLGNIKEEQYFSAGNKVKVFPSYLSASLLAIVRCRAQVERALGESTVRRTEGNTYQFIAMVIAADSVLDGIGAEINDKILKMGPKQADRMANELQFLVNTLSHHLSQETMTLAEQCRRMLCSKAARGKKNQNDGPDGLVTIEDLERLGRVYVLCLGE